MKYDFSEKFNVRNYVTFAASICRRCSIPWTLGLVSALTVTSELISNLVSDDWWESEEDHLQYLVLAWVVVLQLDVSSKINKIKTVSGMS